MNLIPKTPFVAALGAALSLASPSNATETENHGLRVLPAPGAVAMDGQIGDWDLSAGIFACGQLEQLRERSALWFHAMHDSENLYLLARWKDETPLNNPESQGGHSFNGDCLQFRCILFPDTPDETVTWWNAWRDNKGISIVDRSWPGKTNGVSSNPLPDLANAVGQGVKQSFRVDEGAKGYVQEIAVPWKMLSLAGRAPKIGERFRFTIEPNFTAGAYGRITIKDIFDDKVAAPDRVFTFRAYKHWGWATLSPTGKALPQPVRVADGRTFPVALPGGIPAVTWNGLERRFEWPGFKPISFNMPFEGTVSLNLLNEKGSVVRHLLNETRRSAGPVTVRWDGLTDATYRTPGHPVAAGNYTWKAIAHPGATLALRGYAGFSGAAPWQATPQDFWLGDHGAPSDAETDGTRMYLACNGAEGGRHLIATDFDGKLIWSLQNTTGAADPNDIAVDGGTIFVLHPKASWMKNTTLISRVDAKTGAYQKWPGLKNHILSPTDAFGAEAVKSGLDHLDSFDAHGGLIYGTIGGTTIYNEDIDWPELLAKVKADTALSAKVFADVAPERLAGIERFFASQEKNANQQQSEVMSRIRDNLNDLLLTTDMAPGVAKMQSAQRVLANRRLLEERLALRRVEHWIVVLDGQSGALKKRWPLPLAGAIKVRDEKTAYVVSGDDVLALNLESGAAKPFISGLTAPRALAIDTQGRVLVSLGADHQVAVFSAAGKELGRVGVKGGRQIGPWQPDRMLNPHGIAVDAQGKLWVMEDDHSPKRVSVWALGESVKTAPLVREFFGPTHYGASGGAINPRDPNLMIGEGCEWRIDPNGGQAACVGTFHRAEGGDSGIHNFATFREGTNGRLYLFTNQMRYGTGSIQIWERLGDARYALRAALRNDVKGADSNSGATELWTDLNGDGQEQAGEIQRRSGALYCAGSNSWSLNLGPDFTLYGLDAQDKKLKALTLSKFAANGAPQYDLANLKTLPNALSDGYERNNSCALPDADNRSILVNLRVKDHPAGMLWHCFDLATGKLRWTYPNPYFQVHGSHKAPAPEPGLFRGAYGPIGAAKLAGVGNFWTINGNLGEWWVLNSDGFYVTRLFNGSPFEWNWPTTPAPSTDMTNLPAGSGSEDFGGSVTQAKDGKVYIQSGKVANWNIVLSGLEKTVALPGGALTISEAETRQALALREKAMQAAANPKLTIKKATITFSGNINQDFRGQTSVSYQKLEDAAVTTALAYDDSKLYIGWQVKDATPWVNGATDIAQMYATGDSVDLQLGTDTDARRSAAAKGDLRLSIGNLQGKPTAVLYRFVSEEKKPRAFSSGVVQGWQVDWVDVLAEAEIKVKIEAGKGYVVEAAVPLAALGVKAAPGLRLRGDVGVTHGDSAGVRTRLRTHWANQTTGLVDDVVFELQPAPQNWGEIAFE